MENATHRAALQLPRNLDEDPGAYYYVDGQVFLKDDEMNYIDGFDAEKYPLQMSPSSKSPDAKFKIALKGYTGAMPSSKVLLGDDGGPTEKSIYGTSGGFKDGEDDESNNFGYPKHRVMIRGYSGFLPGTMSLCGVPLIPSEEVQLKRIDSGTTMTAGSKSFHGTSTHALRYSSMHRKSGPVSGRLEQSNLGSAMTNFRLAYRHLDLEERYERATNQIIRRGQTLQMLIRMLQAKLAERIEKHADQIIRARKLFYYFDMDGDGNMNEDEFRQFLEFSNIVLDDVQTLALFGYIDRDHTGKISWDNFEAYCLVQDPEIGNAAVPKAIVSRPESEAWQSVALGKRREEK
jgi:hypothetical protein